MKVGVDLQRVAPVFLITACPNQQRFPEITDDRQVMSQIEFGDIGKKIANPFVRHRLGVKTPHQIVNVGAVLNIFFVHTIQILGNFLPILQQARTEEYKLITSKAM